MSSGKKQLDPPHDPMPNMTAMVDLVMCILIFFMLGSRFVQPEMVLPSAMPVSLGVGGAASDKIDTTIPLILDLRRGGDLGVWVDLPDGSRNKRISPPSGRPKNDAEEAEKLAVYMKDVVGELKARKGQLAGDIRIILRPAGDLEYKYVAAVFGACVDADFKDIVFAVSFN